MLRPTRLDYCQYLLSTPINYTLTHFAEHSERFSYDQINRRLSEDRLMPRLLWEHVKNDVVPAPMAILSLMIPSLINAMRRRSHSPSDTTRGMLAVSSTVLPLLRASMSIRS